MVIWSDGTKSEWQRSGYDLWGTSPLTFHFTKPIEAGSAHWDVATPTLMSGGRRNPSPEWALLRPAGHLPVVAVADLTGFTLSAGEVSTHSEKVRSALASTDFFSLLSRRDTESVLSEQSFPRSGRCDDAQCLVEMGKLLSATTMVGGTIGRVGGRYSMSLRLVDVETAKTDVQVDRDATCTDEALLDGIRSLAEELAVRYAEKTRQGTP